MPRLAFGVAYEGTEFQGWQKQTDVPSVQTQVEAAISQIANHPVNTICGGRTDAGVHALGQVIHCDVVPERPMSAWLRGTNSHLSDLIRILWVKPVEETFHARFSAQKRHYRYWISQQPHSPIVWRDRAFYYPYPLDRDAIECSVPLLLGEKDFQAFRGPSCQSISSRRTLERLSWSWQNGNVFVDIVGNAFLHNMVRNLVGALLLIGRRTVEPGTLEKALSSGIPGRLRWMVPPHGLYLTHIVYPAHYELPQHSVPWPFFTSPEGEAL